MVQKTVAQEEGFRPRMSFSRLLSTCSSILRFSRYRMCFICLSSMREENRLQSGRSSPIFASINSADDCVNMMGEDMRLRFR